METSELYERLKQDIHRFARSIARHEQEANDLVQEALIKSLKDGRLLDLPEHKQRAWFFKVMKNQMIDERRKEKRHDVWEEDLDFPVQAIASNHIEMTELLSKLSRDLSDLVFKRYWLGFNSQEIAKQLDIPASTVRYKLHLAMKQLRQQLEEDLR